MGNIITLSAIYFLVWWTCLFAIINMNTQSHHEAGIEHGDGTDRASPVKHGLGKKLLLNTVISAVIFGVGLLIIYSGIIPLPEIPTR